jgi:hypothetical protein
VDHLKKRSLLLVVVIILFILPPSSNVSGETLTSEKPQMVRMTIGFEDEIDLSVFDKYPHEIHHIFDRLEAVSITLPHTAIYEITKFTEIDWFERDQVVQIDGQVIDWGHSPVKVGQARSLDFTGQGVKVAVIDTGINGNHPDLDVAGGISLVEGIAASVDDNGHGTHVAGIIAALDNTIGVAGVAPDVELYSIKALDSDGIGNQTDVVAGIEWAIEHEIDIVNLSITSPFDSLALKRIIEKASAQGILITAASGNDETGAGQPEGSDVLFPARYKEVIGVGSVNNKLIKSTFSYKGISLEFAAPGEKVYSTYVTENGDTNGYSHMTGTSMAAPYVAGVIALYKQAHPELSSTEIRALLQNNARDLGEAGKDSNFGYGLVQAPYNKETSSFPDIIEGSWYSEAVNYLSGQHFITGYPDGTFKPSNKITREEAITLLGRTLDLDGTMRKTAFSDVNPDSFGSGFIASGYDRDVITGYGDGTFRPKQFITRADVALMIYRAYDYLPIESSAFKDVKKDKYYYEAVSTLQQLKIVDGYEDGTFKPVQNISRAEFSLMLARALNDEFKAQ